MGTAILVSAVAAIAPTLIYVAIFYLADRYEREPLWLLVAAFLWGAVPAIIVSVLGEMVLGARFISAPGTAPAALLEGSIIVPVVEEIVKGSALFAIYWWAYDELDNVLDGLVYGAMIGFGFAMTENFLYFVGAYGQGGYANLTVVIFLRAILFGLNHALYSGLTGIGLGLARLARNPVARWLYPLLGLLAAIAAHSLHNFGIALTAANSVNILFSVALASLGLALLIIVIGLTWQYERRCLRQELADEVGVTLSQSEYETLLRKRLRSPRQRNARERRRLQLGAELALRKNRLRTLGTEREPNLPQEIKHIRTQLMNI
jgi:RsiW-degrading membrane proteinase PrsW (M82 family)